MKIVYLTHSFKPYFRGVEHVVERMAREMSKKGNEVEVLTLTPPFSPLPKVERVDGYTVKRFLGLNPSNAYYVPPLSFFKALVSLQADIVHAHAVHTLVPLAAYLARKFKPCWDRFIITPHFHDVGFSRHSNIAWNFYRPLLRKVIESADIVHSISEHEASLLKRSFHIDPVIIPHGVSEDVYRYKWIPQNFFESEGFTVIYSGQLMKYKRVDLLLKAMSILNKHIPAAKAVIIGNGPEKNSLKRMAEELKVEAVFIPPLQRKEYLDYLASSNALCYLSESEAFCVTVLEALAIGVPTVVVEPWGNTFKKYSRVMVLSPPVTTEKVFEALISLRKKTFSYYDKISTWSEVINEFDKLYS